MELTMLRRIIGLLIAMLWSSMTLSAQQGAAEQAPKPGEWRAWGGDLASTRYAPLDQINAGNFNTLEVAWRFKTENLGKIPDFNMQSTPLIVNGVLYFTAGAHRDAIAADAPRIRPITTAAQQPASLDQRGRHVRRADGRSPRPRAQQPPRRVSGMTVARRKRSFTEERFQHGETEGRSQRRSTPSTRTACAAGRSETDQDRGDERGPQSLRRVRLLDLDRSLPPLRGAASKALLRSSPFLRVETVPP